MFLPPQLKTNLIRIRTSATLLRNEIGEDFLTPRDRALVELCQAIEAALIDL